MTEERTFKAGDTVCWGRFEGVLLQAHGDLLKLEKRDNVGDSNALFCRNGCLHSFPAAGPVLELVKLAPREARKFWVASAPIGPGARSGEGHNYDAYDYIASTNCWSCPNPPICVREVLPGEVVVTRERLSKLVETLRGMEWYFNGKTDPVDDLCRALGLE